METWMKEYEKQLRRLVAEQPEKYPHDLDQIPLVLEGRRVAIIQKSYDNASDAVKATCAVFGIKHSKAAIQEFINSHS